MRELKNFVAVDWRAGKDKIFFFFKDSNTYSRFDIGDNRVPDGYPAPISHSNWHDFHVHAKNLRFGFTTTDIHVRANTFNFDQDYLWLFYVDRQIPMVCKYDQDNDKVVSIETVDNSMWSLLGYYFDDIIAGTWWTDSADSMAQFRFLMKNGQSLILDLNISPFNFDAYYEGHPTLKVVPINNTTWPGLEPYKDRIITAVQNDRAFVDSYYYIFLTNNEYITYNIMEDRVEYGPYKVSEKTWPGLLRD
ncbi:hypothetical protein [Pseudomonas sp. dw_612]|uniref:hypothetical protein n=1 Tax=Pseudomonas sp. dw_612 TaxID=2720080 RepID=UPI001BD54D68|nr:hypothetical protein [Pseudomonas sp. dw_612]